MFSVYCEFFDASDSESTDHLPAILAVTDVFYDAGTGEAVLSGPDAEYAAVMDCSTYVRFADVIARSMSASPRVPDIRSFGPFRLVMDDDEDVGVDEEDDD